MAKKQKKTSTSRSAARRPTSPRRAAERDAHPAPKRAKGVSPAAPVTHRPEPAPLDPRITVVGVGASAGGLEAFSQLLRAIEDPKDLAIVFVQHLSPDHDSALVTLLAGQTSLRVVQATDGMRIRAGFVHVIPPNAQMEMRGGELYLSPRPPDRTRYTPVDVFFVSMAESAGPRAVAVVLSGTATDGSGSLREVKYAGGTVFAQSPESAKYQACRGRRSTPAWSISC